MGDDANSVLVAEGADDLRSDYVAWLRDEGYQVLAAANGLEALEFARARGPGVVVMNMDLPVLDGWATARALRRDPRLHATKIVALVAARAKESEARAAGCSAVVRIPARRSTLVSAVADFLPTTDLESLDRVKVAQPVGVFRSWLAIARGLDRPARQSRKS
jgi:two-component system, cell cycle response regulator DivK